MTSVRSVTPAMEGYYLVRAQKGGALLPGRIFTGCVCNVSGVDNQVHEWTMACDRSPRQVGMLCGEYCTPEDVWLKGSLRAITKEEYDTLLAQTQWDQKFDKEAPSQVGKVDFNRMKSPF